MKVKLSVLEPKWLLVVVFFIAGSFVGGVGIYLYLGVTQQTIFKVHSGENRYRYINPILVVDTAPKQSIRENSISLELESKIDKAKRDGKINNAAVYFRDIDPGLWVGINEGLRFSPGKLLKIPIMIAYYKMAESDPLVLDDKIVYRSSSTAVEDVFGTAKSLVVGKTYSVEQIIEAMVVDSDDNAANLLFDHIDKDQLNEILSDLGVNFKEEKGTTDIISLKQYSLFFRVLYGATYLNREYSEKALGLLAKTSDKWGLGVLLPQNVEFSNRLGARSFFEGQKKLYEVYDCGIVYYPKHNYLICSVATGGSIESLKTFLSEVGSSVYTEIKYQYE